MQIVIDIPECFYEYCKAQEDAIEIQLAVANGIPLPKGHGDLIYRESAESIFKNARKELYEQSRKKQIKDFQTREMMLLNAEQFVHLIEPIIEADKTESEDKPKGRWIDIGNEGLVFKCSICGTKKTIESHYCPNCGAKMAESEEEE